MFRSGLTGKLSDPGEPAVKLVSEIWTNWEHPVRRELSTDKLIDGGGTGEQIKKEILVREDEVHLFKGVKYIPAKPKTPNQKVTYERRRKKDFTPEPKRKAGQMPESSEESFT
jgi:hypothetical protein